MSLITESLNFEGQTACWLDSQQSAGAEQTAKLHFATANGFPAASYQPFLTLLSEHYEISSMDNRGAWYPRSKPPLGFGMQGFAKDWITGIKQKHAQPVIGIGHSHGAQVNLHAALLAPDLFSKLILIEPATLPYAGIDGFYRFMPKWLMHTLFPFIRRTAARQQVWQSKDAFLKRYENHPTFRLFNRASLQAYADHGLRKNQHGTFELAFDPNWESYIFRKIRFLWYYLYKTKHPTLLIRGAQSSLISSERFAQYNQKLSSNVDVIELDNAHHMLPQEQPERVVKIVKHWIENH